MGVVTFTGSTSNHTAREEVTTSTTLQRLVGSTMQGFLWDMGEEAMNLDHTKDVFSVETSTAEITKPHLLYEFTSQSPLNTSFPANLSFLEKTANVKPSVKLMVYTIIQAVVITIGLIANALTLLVMLRRTVRTERMAVFLIPLALFDFFKLIADFHMSGLIHIIPNTFDIFTYSQSTCGAFSSLTFASSCISSWILVIMTAERACSVVDPLIFKRNWSKKVSIILVLLVVLVCSLLSIVSLYVIELQTDPISGAPRCALKQGPTELLVASIVDAMVYSIVPSIALLVLNALIIKGLRRAVTNSLSQANPARAAKERAASITIMCISLSFLVSVLPFGIYEIYFMLPQSEKQNHLWFEVFVLSSLNHSMNFFFYIVCGSRFRSEFLAMFTCRQT